MTDGLAGFLWNRQGVTATTDIAAGQFVNVIPVVLGTKNPVKTSAGADGVWAFTQAASVTGLPKFNVAAV